MEALAVAFAGTVLLGVVAGPFGVSFGLVAVGYTARRAMTKMRRG